MGKYQGVKTLEVLEGAEHYNDWIAQSLQSYIKSPALEIGAGTGNLSERFVSLGELVLTDVDPELVNILKKKFGKRKNITVEPFDVAAHIGKVTKHFATVYAINVLEHINDDNQALRNMKLLLAKEGRVVLLVPAKKFAFTKLDQKLGHHRRYEKKELRNKLEKAGFSVERLSFFNIVGLLSWLVRDKLSGDDKHLKKSHVKIFDSIVPLLRLIEPKNSLPLGISIIAVAKKK